MLTIAEVDLEVRDVGGPEYFRVTFDPHDPYGTGIIVLHLTGYPDAGPEWEPIEESSWDDRRDEVVEAAFSQLAANCLRSFGGLPRARAQVYGHVTKVRPIEADAETAELVAEYDFLQRIDAAWKAAGCPGINDSPAWREIEEAFKGDEAGRVGQVRAHAAAYDRDQPVTSAELRSLRADIRDRKRKKVAPEAAE